MKPNAFTQTTIITKTRIEIPDGDDYAEFTPFGELVVDDRVQGYVRLETGIGQFVNIDVETVATAHAILAAALEQILLFKLGLPESGDGTGSGNGPTWRPPHRR